MKNGVTSYTPWKENNNSKRDGAQIKRLAIHKAATESSIEERIRFPRKKKTRTGIILDRKTIRKPPNHGVTQFYCVLCNMYGMNQWKYMSHSYDICFVKRSDQMKEDMGDNLGNRYKYVNNLRKSNKKCKRELKYFNKQQECYIYWPITPDIVGISRRSRRSSPRWKISTSYLVAIDLAVILNPPSIVKVSDI